MTVDAVYVENAFFCRVFNMLIAVYHIRFLMWEALLNKSELVTTAPHTGRLLRDVNTVRHS